MDQSSINRRQSPGQAGIGLAEVVATNGWGSILCSVCNQSDYGAMLGVPADFRFPKHFGLRHITTDIVRPARLVWQKYGLAGIEFIGD